MSAQNENASSPADPRVFALICVVLGGMGQGIVAPNLPEILREADLLALASGISATLMYLGIFLSTYRYGRLADRGKVHWILGPCLWLYAVCLAALGTARNPPLLFAIRFIEGIAISGVYVSADFILGRLSPSHERGRWLSYYGVALSIGLLLGPLAALWIPHPLAAASALVAIAGTLALRTRVPQADSAAAVAGTLPASPLLSGAVYGAMEAALVAVFPILAAREFHVSPELCLVTVIAAAAASSVPLGILSDRIGPARVVVPLIGLLGAGSSALVMTSGSLGPRLTAYLSCAFYGMLAGGIYPVAFSWMLQKLPESHYGEASGSFARFYGMGSLVGPFAAGLLVQAYGSPGLFALLAALGAAGFACTVREFRA